MVLLCAALALTVGVAAASAGKGGNSGNAKICQKGGWASPNLQDGTGQPLTFASQDECVSYGATHGQLFDPSLTADPAHVVENQESFFIASGFHPSSTGTLTVHVLGGSDGTSTFTAVTTDTGGLPAGVGTVFTTGACASGIYAAEITLVDGFGVHASTTAFLDCP
jgi:hypothetical protein